MLFKKDYQRAADIVRDIRKVNETAALVTEQAFIDFFVDTKGKFDEDLFRKACK